MTPATTTEGVASQQLVTSGKTICCRVKVRNLGTGSAILVDVNGPSDVGTNVYPTRADAFRATAAPTSEAMEFARGQAIRNDLPSASGDPGWVCTTTGRPATFKALGNLDA